MNLPGFLIPAAAHYICATAGVFFLDDRYIFSLRAFLALCYAELNFLAFIQWLVAAGVIDLLKMYENIGAWFLLNKAEAFIRIKPFNGASSDCWHDVSYIIK